jgi:flagellin-specific chaperone FliS
LGYEDGKISKSLISLPSAKEKVPIDKINKNVIFDKKINGSVINTNITNILNSGLIYDNLSHSLRRIYKLLMNSLYNTEVTNKIVNLSGGKIGRKYVTSFLYYPLQDQNKHAIKDCGYIQLDDYSETYNYAFVDTKYVLELCIDAFIATNNRDVKEFAKPITDLYSYLINNTYHMSEENLKKKVATVNHDNKNYEKTNKKFASCMAENVGLTVSGFKVTQKKMLDDLASKKFGEISVQIQKNQTGGNCLFCGCDEHNISMEHKNSYIHKCTKYENKNNELAKIILGISSN